MSVAARLVVIMGTQYYDSSGATGGTDYPVTDLLQMMGRASRPDIDDFGRSALACVAAASLVCPSDCAFVCCCFQFLLPSDVLGSVSLCVSVCLTLPFYECFPLPGSVVCWPTLSVLQSTCCLTCLSVCLVACVCLCINLRHLLLSFY